MTSFFLGEGGRKRRRGEERKREGHKKMETNESKVEVEETRKKIHKKAIKSFAYCLQSVTMFFTPLPHFSLRLWTASVLL